MLQFDRSQTINTNAVYPDTAASIGTSQVLLDFTQSYDLSTVTGVVANLANVVSETNPWLVIQVSGSYIPNPSGQYIVNIYDFTVVGGVRIRGTLLSTERAYVIGNNEYSITQYLLPTNGGTYTTYNYPGEYQYLLLEDDTFLLLENGTQILLEQQ